MRVLLLIAVAFLECSCGPSARVAVKDPSGRPVVGARVQVIYASFPGVTYKTNSKGEAEVPTTSGMTFYGIGVSKAGFDQDEYSWPPPGDGLKVVLHPGNGRRLHGQPFDPNALPRDAQGLPADGVLRPARQ